ncbi:MAG: LysE family translocator [Hyphomonadaceae bacterium]|nr:LysE family translocator [Hyphomonadaceae bacterium]
MTPGDGWPVDPAMIAPFLAAMALVELTPGPNMVWLAVLTLAQGRASGLRAVAGVTLGLAIYMTAAAFGVGSAIAAAPGLYDLLRLAGVVYLLWLAIDAWRDADDEDVQPGATPFVRGLVANLLNPKAALFYVTLLPGFIDPARAPFRTQALMFGASHIVISVIVHAGIVFGAAHVATWLARGADAWRAVRLRRIAAVGIGLVAIWLWWETRR